MQGSGPPPAAGRAKLFLRMASEARLTPGAHRAGGLEVSGCVTTTRLGKPSTGRKGIACLTDRANQKRLRGEFESVAGLFHEIMINDFWFTDCACPA
jgi:hypothetical protein